MHAVVSASTEEPYASKHVILIVRRSDWYVVGELVMKVFAIVTIRIELGDAKGILSADLKHLILINICVKIMPSRHDTKWYSISL